ncbi:hypothetical protein DQ04_13021010 [Trypanosoma grayi]|uniref:hypothetical protein n=1 Tax=Trypanosoma grayi TaxID=71804 RepID=UPI0004F4209A|nr:hypothetical protein DQ04_13021010 [Trypanosoma grayi]KEG06623.1 hypothetical protein DQ04_13021010 [Trypanosoma grayi]
MASRSRGSDHVSQLLLPYVPGNSFSEMRGHSVWTKNVFYCRCGDGSRLFAFAHGLYDRTRSFGIPPSITTYLAALCGKLLEEFVRAPQVTIMDFLLFGHGTNFFFCCCPTSPHLLAMAQAGQNATGSRSSGSGFIMGLGSGKSVQ